MENWQKNNSIKEEAIALVTALEKHRTELLEKLDRLCSENPELDGNYWWKLKKDPALGEALLIPGKIPKEDEWAFIVLNQPWFKKIGQFFCLDDMITCSVEISMDDVQAMMDSAKNTVVYRMMPCLEKMSKVLR